MKTNQLKNFLNQLHLWRFYLRLWDTLNDKPTFHFSYQPPGYWLPIESPEAQRALILDDELGMEE